MSQIKLNINNAKNLSGSSEKELIERARVKMEERRNLDDAALPEKPGKTWLFVLISAILIVAASAGTFVFAQKNNRQAYKKYIPKTSIISASLAPAKLSETLSQPKPIIFSGAIEAIKSETIVLGIDAEKLLSEIKKEIIIASVKSENDLQAVIIAELPENFEKQNLEDKIRQNFNVSYRNYRGEKIITVESLELNKRNEAFSYAIIENTLLISQNLDALKASIDAGKN